MKRLILALLLIGAPVQATDKAKIDALYAKRKADDKQLLANVRESRAARAKSTLEADNAVFMAQILAAQHNRNQVSSKGPTMIFPLGEGYWSPTGGPYGYGWYSTPMHGANGRTGQIIWPR